MDPDELDDYLDLQDPAIRQAIEQGEQQARDGQGRDGHELLAEIRNESATADRTRRA